MSSVTKGGEYEKLPKIGSGSAQPDQCIVPFIDKKPLGKLKDDNLRKFDNCIPDDLILSLKQAEQPKQYLGPPSKKNVAVNLSGFKSIIKRPDNAWNHEKQREKLKFLTEQPICSCGAGKDMTFLYDSVLHEKPSNKPPVSKYDLSAIRQNETSNQSDTKDDAEVSDSLIPDEFKVVINHGVAPLKVDKSEFATVPDDHPNHLTAFPSLKPTSRYEVMQLKHTMDAMLSRVGADIVDQKGPTQLHNLLEIIKQEQDIYNIIFHEVIRQVTVECKDRGEILAKLRERYANLLSRVPREIKSLYEEIIAQRALDRRLAEELTQFKNMVAVLTEELAKVKEHDKRVGEQADIYKNDLRKAIVDAERNASMLTEYHSLYELQRKRLEKTIDSLIEERDLWIKTAYGISIKVCEENKLNTCKRLNLVEKSWFKLAKHFALMLSDRDTKDLMVIQKIIQDWKSTIEETRTEVGEKENRIRRELESCQLELINLRIMFSEMAKINPDGVLESLPNTDQLSTLLIHLKRIHERIMTQMEDFSGDAVLTSEEKLKKCEHVIFSMVQTCTSIKHRHDIPKEKMDECMKYDQIQKKTKRLQEQYRVRTSGENGISRNMIVLINGMDVWVQKLLYAQYSAATNKDTKKENNNKGKLGEQEWMAMYQSFDEWFSSLAKTLKSIGNPLKDSNEPKIDEDTDQKVEIVDHDSLCNEINSWVAAFDHFVDSQDAFLVEQVHVYHTKMVHWMVQVVIRLAKDREELSDEAKKLIYETTSSVDNLEKISLHLGESIEKFTNTLAEHSNSIITHEENNRKANEPSVYEREFNDIKNLQSDQQEWKYTAKILIAELKGDKSYRKSLIGDRLSSFAGSTREKEIEMEEEAGDEEEDQVLMDELKSPSPDEAEKQEEETQEEAGIPLDPTMFETINQEANTERLFLENINLEDGNELSEAELKTTVFNALKTIEKLQTDLVKTEERAQSSEVRVSELEVQLKGALEKIRELEAGKK